MWVDKIIKSVPEGIERIIINDSKTPSGRVHVGSLRGVLIHDAISRSMKKSGLPAVFTYGIDDYDPMDGLPANAPAEVRAYMGHPLCNVPAPEGSSATDMAEHYIAEFMDIFKELNVDAQVYRMRDIYRNGDFNEAIDIILNNAATVRDIYKKVSGAERPENWYPFQTICENCGKIGTTEVYDYDGKVVSYRCRADLVSWAEGCGHEGTVSPFDGNGKLPWKLEWAAKWYKFGITIEGAGKDHCTKGGSRDVASQVVRRVFKTSPPVNVPYEFFLIEGAKMSSSKGLGASAREMADFLPPEMLRFLMVKTEPKKAVNFSTDFKYMLKIFNEYDQLIENYNDNAITDEQEKIILISEVSENSSHYEPASFQLITSLLQLPHIDTEEEAAKRLKIAPNSLTRANLIARIKAAKYWLENFATEDDKYELQSSLPASADTLSAVQKMFLHFLSKNIQQCEWNETALQTHVFNVSRATPMPQKLAFEAIYRVFLDKTAGPKAGALLSFLDKDFVAQRLNEVPYSPLLFIEQAGVDEDALLTKLESIKKDISDVRVLPELHICYENERALSDEGSFAYGFGVCHITYSQKNRVHGVRFCAMVFEGHSAIDEQKARLIAAQALVSDAISNIIDGTVSADNSVTSYVEFSPEKIAARLAGKN